MPVLTIILDPRPTRADNSSAMSASTRKKSKPRTSPQTRAAREAEEVAKSLRAFAVTLNALDQNQPAKPTPRNWWRKQAGRFAQDQTFPAFVAQVQAARKRED